ncbi:hypothetical protein HYX04_02330 [Candidatus Woesearchaeota archaeon]|nr:hypothetical protein [Candidatus Woesearchaeota archaeon]
MGALSGAVYGYCFNEQFPYATRYVHERSGMENSFTKKVTGVAGGATGGMLGATAMSILLEHYLKKHLKK